MAIRPADIKPDIEANLFTKFETALTASSVVSVKSEALVAINVKETKVVRKTEAFVCPLAVQVSYTDRQTFQSSLSTAFQAAFSGKNFIFSSRFNMDIP